MRLLHIIEVLLNPDGCSIRRVQTRTTQRAATAAWRATVLLVCAVASRWCADPRMGAPGGIGIVPHADANVHHPPVAMNGLSCGWAWFDQVPLAGNHVFGQATLYDLQYYCFLEGSSAPQAHSTIVGVGLRLARVDCGFGWCNRSTKCYIVSI
ncbi:hypothetical protein GGX14DRAFT_670714 [Mycena pura]|uniref:Uncharacterized protein n=1 Tax=Mycena pura TaxID=153505 RepID=A0AAD6VW03_9AGAR|nr:hypothetical protein GGX14DRAFT_670714 [Mycena pura]